MSLYEIAFEPTHLTEDELKYELKVRNITTKGTSRILSKILREYLIKESKGIYVKPKHTENASTEVSHINSKLDELDITMMGLEDLPNNEFVIDALISRYVHIFQRLERILVANNPDISKAVKTFNKRIKDNLSRLEKLKESKIKPQVHVISDLLNNTILGPRTGAADVMASNLLTSGEFASGLQAGASQNPIPITSTITPPSVVSGKSYLGAYPKTHTSNTISPICSATEYVAGRGRGVRLDQTRNTRSLFSEKSFYASHSHNPPVSTSLHCPSSSISNSNLLPSYVPSPVSYTRYDYPPPYYTNPPQSLYTQSNYNPPRSVPSSNYHNLNINAQQGIMTVPYSSIQQPLNNYNPSSNVPHDPYVPYVPHVPLLPQNQFNHEMDRPLYHHRNPVSGWNLFFSGESNSRSLYDFLSRIDMLARAENISELLLRRSAYYLFTGSAMTWYRAFEQNYPTWTDLVNALKNQFIPLDYDRALLREVEKRKQGATESFGMYLANMEMLYRGIQRTVIPDIVKLDTIMRNMLPYLTEKLMLVDINSIEELANYCRKIENTQFRMAQMNLPNDHPNLLEPQFAYKNPGNLQRDAVPRLGGQYPRK